MGVTIRQFDRQCRLTIPKNILQLANVLPGQPAQIAYNEETKSIVITPLVIQLPADQNQTEKE